MKPLSKVVIVIIMATLAYVFSLWPNLDNTETSSENQQIIEAFHNRESDVIVTGTGRVTKLLKDDLKGSRHQRFIIEITSGMTLLVAHNIDLADKIEDLQVGDTVSFRGEYEWNNRGGVIHWTHRAPRNNHEHGYIQHNGRRYQ